MSWSLTAKKAAQPLFAGRRVWLYAVQLDVKAGYGSQAAVNQWVLLTSWDENITFDSRTYYSYPIKHDKVEGNTKGDLPETGLTIVDFSGLAAGMLLAHSGLEGKRVFITAVKYEHLSTPENSHTEDFEIMDSEVDAERGVVNLKLGQPSLNQSPFPNGLFIRNSCRFGYKSPDGRCGSTSTLPDCSFTLDGPNGCAAHDNTARFGGFPTIPGRR
jgi:phage-related protein